MAKKYHNDYSACANTTSDEQSSILMSKDTNKNRNTKKPTDKKEQTKIEYQRHDTLVNNNFSKTETELLGVRVIKKNLIYIVGFSTNMNITEELLRKQNFFWAVWTNYKSNRKHIEK